MAYTFDQVKELSLNPMTADDVGRAVITLNSLEGLLDRDWLEMHEIRGRTAIHVRQAVQQWAAWEAVASTPGSRKLLTHWRQAKSPADAGAVEFELLISADIAASARLVEIHPIVGNRSPDASFDVSGRSVYIEASVRSVTDRLTRTQQALGDISRELASSHQGRHALCAINAVVDELDIPHLLAWIRTYGTEKAYDPHVLLRAYEIEDLDLLHAEAKSFIHGSQRFGTCLWRDVEGIVHKGTAAMRVHDPYCLREFADEARQLPTEAPGVVCLDLSFLLGEFLSWSDEIRKRLAIGDRFTRVGAVVLVAMVGDPSCGLRTANREVIINPHAAYALTLEEAGVIAEILPVGPIGPPITLAG